MRATVRLLTGAICGTVLTGLAVVPAVTPASAAPRADRTSAVEARRVDRVPTPKLDWFGCYDYAECATVRLPLDYDQPKGATTEIAVLRVKARKQNQKIGSLFLNPGGPGGSGTSIALAAPFFLGAEVLDRFDIVGVDPRGIASSDNVRCFRSTQEQTEKLAGMSALFPVGRAEEKAFVGSARQFGRSCSTTGRPLSGAMSTAEVARDMDVLRRAVGDRKLTYLGFSYGTALGQYYANMFPDRVRAVVVDGVINPVSWAGTNRTKDIVQDERLRSADGAYKALSEILKRCDAAGTDRCALAGDAAGDFATVARRLKAEPLVFEDELGQFTFGYADFVGGTLGNLYDPAGAQFIVDMVVELLALTDPGASTARKASARKAVTQRLAKARADARAEARGRDFPYDNGFETYAGVACTDGLHPKDAGLWPGLMAQADRRAPYFGRAWGWGTVMCARNTWTVRDEDAYRGPFNRRTSAPVLFVGNFWDPATNYDDAVSSARLLPNSRLLSSDSWGHTAYGTSACATGAVDEYLLRVKLPARGTVCVGDLQPFASAPAAQRAAAEARTDRPSTNIEEVAKEDAPAAGEPKQLPPVVPPVPAVPVP